MSTTLIVANGHITPITGTEETIVRDNHIFVYDTGTTGVQAVNFLAAGGGIFGGVYEDDRAGGIYFEILEASDGVVFGGQATCSSYSLNIAEQVAVGGGIFGGAADQDGVQSTNLIAEGGGVFGGGADVAASITYEHRPIVFTVT